MKNKIIMSAFIALFYQASTDAIVIRHDVDDKKYLAKPEDFPPLATLYSIGVHGTLIAPNWVVTAGHTIFCMEPGDKIKVGEQWAEIEARYTHAKFELEEENDIALLKLKNPIRNIQPAKLYRGSAENNTNIWFIGRGNTGNGLTGQISENIQKNGKLRKAENKIEKVSEREIYFVFDEGEDALPLEGVSGNADSGGPAYKLIEDDYYLFGISSRIDSLVKGVGEYGVDEVYSRVSFHAPWIDKVMSNDREYIEKNTTQYHFAQDEIINNLVQVCEMIGFK